MSTLLQINTGIFGDQSQSTKLANEFTARWKSANPNGDVVIRDLITNPVPHLDAAIAGAFFTPEDQRTDEQQRAVSLSDELIAELDAADVVVIGVPMYNFDIPSQLKAYFDQLARAGVTFKYTENGPVGLLRDKPVYVMAARGGVHQGQASDTQTGFLKTFLGFIGLQQVAFVYAEGLSMGEDAQQQAFSSAREQIESAVA